MNEIYFVISIFLFGLVMTITPGPNNIMLFSSGLNFGFKKTQPHAIGIWFGNVLMFIICGSGMAQLFLDIPIAQQILKIASCIFLLYLAWKFGSTPPKNINYDKKRKPLSFLQACLFQWINPKAWIFIISSIALFSTGKYVVQETLIIGITLVITMIISTTLWSYGGHFLQRFLQSAGQQRIFNVLMGIILALTVIPMLFIK